MQYRKARLEVCVRLVVGAALMRVTVKLKLIAI